MDNAIKNPRPGTEQKLLKPIKSRKFTKRKRNVNLEAVKETKPEQKRENRQSAQYSGLFLYTKI